MTAAVRWYDLDTYLVSDDRVNHLSDLSEEQYEALGKKVNAVTDPMQVKIEELTARVEENEKKTEQRFEKVEVEVKAVQASVERAANESNSNFAKMFEKLESSQQQQQPRAQPPRWRWIQRARQMRLFKDDLRQLRQEGPRLAMVQRTAHRRA